MIPIVIDSQTRATKDDKLIYQLILDFTNTFGGRRGGDRMIVGFTTTYAISIDHY